MDDLEYVSWQMGDPDADPFLATPILNPEEDTQHA